MSTDHPHVNRRIDIPPDEAIKPPLTFGEFPLDEAVLEKLPIPGTRVISSKTYGMSLWGRCCKILAELPDKTTILYFLKVAKGPNAPMMCEGEFESLNAMNQALSSIAPKALAWGKYKNEDTYFMMAEFREIGQQPPDPIKFTSRLAKMHEVSVSPTGRFGFHTTTCHGFIPQATNMWEDSWAVLYQKQLAHMLAIDLEKNGPWAEFEQLSDLTLKKVIPRLLNPLQSEGRSIKPCLLHGDCWDENTATDMENGEPFVFDAGSFYGHNEYDIGNWRAPRHRLSSKVYVRNYKRHFAVSEPEDDWDGRNLLYSLRFNVGAAILIPGCNQREVVFEGMKELCRTYCLDDYRKVMQGADQDASDELGEKDEEEEEEEAEDEEEEEEEQEKGHARNRT